MAKFNSKLSNEEVERIVEVVSDMSLLAICDILTVMDAKYQKSSYRVGTYREGLQDAIKMVHSLHSTNRKKATDE